MWPQDQQDRIAMLRREWEPKEKNAEGDELCTAGTVETKHVRNSSDYRDESGVTYYRCGGGRRVIRKRIGGD